MSSSKSSSGNDDVLGASLLESWVEVSGAASHGGGTPASITQQLTVEDYLRLLREAQESNQSSCRDSLASSRRGSPRGSPKSPPNSPVVQGTALNLEWQSYYVNSESKEDFLPFDWSSRPDSMPSKPWSFRAPHKYDMFSLRYARIGNTPLFSKRGICIMFLTNLFSLLFGTGVGVFLNRYGLYFSVPAIKVR
ncbi:BCL2/adenovirus E1B 19 kDa protein-interacting protein 3 isoform X1 [Euwallacea similis]|uniref:BCL2/adenovirus E1B 19 kDa protein-interacting protein 3 isoform X1 n=1 Tax=Euwallacea similis TaxID=1736056 RepID=UPI00344E59F2